MPSYYVKLFGRHSDSAVHATQGVYLSRRGVRKLSHKRMGLVQAGDKVYLNSHGDHGEVGPRRRGDGWYDAGQVAARLIQHGLGDGAPTSPILLKCVACFSGGANLGDEERQYRRATGGRFDQVGARYTAHLADGSFAQALALALGQTGRQHILVGGYPGALKGRRKSPTNHDLRVHCAWFDTQGQQLLRAAPDLRHQGEFVVWDALNALMQDDVNVDQRDLPPNAFTFG